MPRLTPPPTAIPRLVPPAVSSIVLGNAFSWEEWDQTDNKLEYAAKLRIPDLANLVTELSAAYYNAEPLVTDAEFDKIQEVLSLLDPGNPVLKQVGSAIPDSDPGSHSRAGTKTSFNPDDYPHLVDRVYTNPLWRQKIRLPFLMPSMDKSKPKDISKWNNWIANNPGPYNISDKVDGMSAGLIYGIDSQTNKVVVLLTSRGDGEIGEDLSAILPHLSVPGGLLPISLELEAMIREHGSLQVRGEIVIPIEEFEKTFGKGFALRNVARGIIGGKTLRSGLIKFVDFIAYELVHPWPKGLTQGLQNLGRLGFHVVHNEYTRVPQLTLSELRETLLRRKRDSEYEIDGLIVTQDVLPARTIQVGDAFPDYAMAFKFDTDSEDTESALSIVRNVQWNTSKDGKLNPVAVIKPVGVGGVTIENVTMHNAAYVKDMAIGPGAIVRVTRGGDVIPQIVANLRPVQPQMPSVPYEWNETGRSISLLDPEMDPAVMLSRVQFFFKKLGVANWGDSNVQKIVEYNLPAKTDILDILDMTVEDLEELPGVQRKMAEKLWKSLHDKLGRTDLTVLMAASNLFGAGFGSRRLQALFDAMPDFLRQPFRTAEERSQLLSRIVAIPGFQAKTGTALVRGLPKFIPFLYGIYRTGWIAVNLRRPGVPVAHTIFPANSPTPTKTVFRSLGNNIDEMTDDLNATGRSEYDQADYDRSSMVQMALFKDIDTVKAAEDAARAARVAAMPKLTPPPVRLPTVSQGPSIPGAKKPSLIGKTIVFTGVFKGFEEQATALGGIVSKSLSGKTDILVKKDDNWTSGKVTKAEKLGTKIMTADEFTAMYL